MGDYLVPATDNRFDELGIALCHGGIDREARTDFGSLEGFEKSPDSYPITIIARGIMAIVGVGRLHVAGVNAGGNATAVNCAGFVPFTMMAAADNSFGYEMEIIVPADSPIKEPTDLKGHKIAFTDATSNSGFKAPSAILKADFQLESKRDFEPVFSGKHDNSILGVVNKDYEAAAVANSVLNRMLDRKVFDPAKIRSIYKSQTFPTTGYGYAHNLDPKLVEKIKEAFFTFQWEGSALQAEFKKEGKFIPIEYKKDWAVLRKIDEANGVKYTCK